ncbi:SLOG family protein [Oligoflexus tunisiensis]|uniref:SLOG family protein n=1 Tax=Oligoflexus tunisiensis TaxID=708132 RepID=UPI00114D2997|nr:SLOG family protein [Oligoflexus tunisiensis]
MKIIVCGSQDFQNKQLLSKTLREYTQRHKVSIIVLGQAHGAETMAAEWAMQNNVRLSIVPTNRKMQAVEATEDRNKRIVESNRDAAAVLHFMGCETSEDLCQRALRNNIVVDDVVGC